MKYAEVPALTGPGPLRHRAEKGENLLDGQRGKSVKGGRKPHTAVSYFRWKVFLAREGP